MFDDQPLAPKPLGRALELMRRIWAVDHAARQLSRIMEVQLGVTGPQRLVIRVVGQRPGLSAGDLAALLHIDASTLSAHLQTLTDAHLIDRRAAADDARRAAIFLTPKGRQLDVRTPGTVEAAVEASLAAIAEADVAAAERFLGRLVDEMRAQGRSAVDGGARRASHAHARKQRRARRAR